MKEAGKHLSDANAFREVEFKEKLVTDLVGTRANFCLKAWVSKVVSRTKA